MCVCVCVNASHLNTHSNALIMTQGAKGICTNVDLSSHHFGRVIPDCHSEKPNEVK